MFRLFSIIIGYNRLPEDDERRRGENYRRIWKVLSPDYIYDEVIQYRLTLMIFIDNHNNLKNTWEIGRISGVEACFFVH